EMGLSSLDTSTDFAVENLRFWWGCLRIVAEREWLLLSRCWNERFCIGLGNKIVSDGFVFPLIPLSRDFLSLIQFL
ncbi:hypothetical protein ACR8G9_22240, partial [Salmonella enterica subsp. enterica serovar Paratyphi A]